MNSITDFFLVLVFLMSFAFLINKGIQSKKDYLDIVWLSPIQTILVGPIQEEALFRGLPILLGEDNPFGYIMLISNSIFVLIHLRNAEKGKILILIDVFVFASIMAWVSINWGILYGVLMHIINNGIAYLILCFHMNKREKIYFSLNTNSNQ